jgi:hypothetical protein
LLLDNKIESMKKSLLFLTLITIPLLLQAQKDTVSVAVNSAKKALIKETSSPNINIYPVPVRESTFTIKADREISAVKVTNMIGQDIFRTKYNSPLSLTKIMLPNPSRGIYLVTISFIDGTRVVKKIMIENPE